MSANQILLQVEHVLSLIVIIHILVAIKSTASNETQINFICNLSIYSIHRKCSNWVFRLELFSHHFVYLWANVNFHKKKNLRAPIPSIYDPQLTGLNLLQIISGKPSSENNLTVPITLYAIYAYTIKNANKCISVTRSSLT